MGIYSPRVAFVSYWGMYIVYIIVRNRLQKSKPQFFQQLRDETNVVASQYLHKNSTLIPWESPSHSNPVNSAVIDTILKIHRVDSSPGVTQSPTFIPALRESVPRL